MRIKPFSKKQREALTWWCPGSPHYEKTAIICDGAVRSGKTFCLSLSFLLWSFGTFHQRDFALCGKTILSLRRNVITPLLAIAEEQGFACRLILSRNLLEITYRGQTQRFHLFGGKDEGSAALIQGMTLAGVLFDEVALMPRSFVEQALARCSVEGARFWFNCNPEHPSHWFYQEWIAKATSREALYLHFSMEDNPSLAPEVLARYQRLYTGVFYQRYVLGEWVASHGAVYPMFSYETHVVQAVPPCRRYLVSCDYGIRNPCSFGLWGFDGTVWYRLREYYHSSREDGVVRTDEEYRDALNRLIDTLPVERVLVDPSAASFIQCLRRQGRYVVSPAHNSVLDGIRLVGSALTEGKLRFHKSCVRSIEEFSLYRWDSNGVKETPRKEHDHAMDEIRYFVHFLSREEPGGFYALATTRTPPRGEWI